jgi:hypothetical protein
VKVKRQPVLLKDGRQVGKGGKANHSWPSVSETDQCAGCVGITAVEYVRCLLKVHGECVLAEFGEFSVEKSAWRCPHRPCAAGDEDRKSRKAE